MNLTYYTSFDISSPGGPNVNEFEFLRSLAARTDIRVDTVLDQRSERALAQISGISKSLFLDIPRFRPRPASILASWQVASAIAHFMHARKSQLLIVRLDEFPLSLWLLSFWFGISIAIKSVGDYWSGAASPINILDRVLWSVRLRLSDSTIRRATIVDAVTPELCILVQRRTARPTPIHHVENSTNVAHFSAVGRSTEIAPHLKGCYPILGYAGSFPATRGGHHILQVMGALKHRFPKIGCVIAGDDGEVDFLRQEAERLGVEKRCAILGRVPYETVPDVIAAIDIAFSLDRSDRAAFIGNSSQKLRQYIAAGRPVLTIREVGSFIEEYDLGSLVSSDNLHALVTATEHWAHRLASSEAEDVAVRLRRFAKDNFFLRKYN